MPKAPQKEITSKTLWSLGRQESKDGNKATELRVVDWIVDGKHFPQLEKRNMFVQEGEWKMGKAKGMSLKDMNIVQDNWGEIMAALGGKAANKAATPAGEPQPPKEEAPAAAEVDF